MQNAQSAITKHK